MWNRSCFYSIFSAKVSISSIYDLSYLLECVNKRKDSVINVAFS